MNRQCNLINEDKDTIEMFQALLKDLVLNNKDEDRDINMITKQAIFMFNSLLLSQYNSASSIDTPINELIDLSNYPLDFISIKAKKTLDEIDSVNNYLNSFK